MKKPLSPASDAPRSARIGAHVSISLKDGDGTEKVLSGIITDQPTKRRLGILLNGRFYFGRANAYSRDSHRLLINGRIIVAKTEDVQLILLSD